MREGEVPEQTSITVTYERKFSDGNYGSEGVSLTYTATYEVSEGLAIDVHLIETRCDALTDVLRDAVLTQLAKSEAPRVASMARRELEPPEQKELIAANGAKENLEDLPF